jgi:hypothetical protein
VSYWILQNMRSKQVSYFEYAAWIETSNRTIDITQIGDVRVATEFCGVDRGFGVGPPLLFETIVSGGPLDGQKWHYASLGEAKQGHHEAVAEVRTSGQSH